MEELPATEQAVKGVGHNPSALRLTSPSPPFPALFLSTWKFGDSGARTYTFVIVCCISTHFIDYESTRALLQCAVVVTYRNPFCTCLGSLIFIVQSKVFSVGRKRRAKTFIVASRVPIRVTRTFTFTPALRLKTVKISDVLQVLDARGNDTRHIAMEILPISLKNLQEPNWTWGNLPKKVAVTRTRHSQKDEESKWKYEWGSWRSWWRNESKL